MVEYKSNPDPLETDFDWKPIVTIIFVVIVVLICFGSVGKVSDGVIRQPEVVKFLQRMEDPNLEDGIIPKIEIQSASSQSLVWGELFMVRYTYVLDGKVQKTVYCTKGPDNPLFCSPYPPQKR